MTDSIWELPDSIKEHYYARYPLPDAKPENKRTKREKAELAKVLRTSETDERQGWTDLVETLRVRRRELLRIPGVTAVDIGYRVKDHKFKDELVLRVHVERKLPTEYFEKGREYDRIPKELQSPSGRTVQVDVLEAEYKLVQLTQNNQLPRPRNIIERPVGKANRRRRLDPLVGGISIGSPQVSVGTLGALVWDRLDGSVCILSNWHVLAGDLSVEPGNPCFQPGLFDQGRSSDVVARLKRWSFNRQTDAAIAELTGSRHYCAGEIVSLFQQISGVANPHLGMMMLKSARSTGFVGGFVDGLYFSAAIEYSNGVVRVFEEQIHVAPLLPKDKTQPIRAISEPGDSGSVWVTETKSKGYRAVGLHFAGDLPRSAFGEYALANPMSVVQERLDFSFRPLFLEIRDEDVVSPPPASVSQPVQVQLGNGGQPISIVLGGLTGAGGQPVANPIGGGGTPPPPKPAP